MFAANTEMEAERLRSGRANDYIEQRLHASAHRLLCATVPMPRDALRKTTLGSQNLASRLGHQICGFCRNLAVPKIASGLGRKPRLVESANLAKSRKINQPINQELAVSFSCVLID